VRLKHLYQRRECATFVTLFDDGKSGLLLGLGQIILIQVGQPLVLVLQIEADKAQIIAAKMLYYRFIQLSMVIIGHKHPLADKMEVAKS
jgi:hypothetical protein